MHSFLEKKKWEKQCVKGNVAQKNVHMNTMKLTKTNIWHKQYIWIDNVKIRAIKWLSLAVCWKNWKFRYVSFSTRTKMCVDGVLRLYYK